MILAIVNDLIVGVRIEEAAKGLGVQVETAGSMEEAAQSLKGQATDVLVVDLASVGPDLEKIAAAAREAGARVIGFYPHVDKALRQAAEGAGIERVYPRSRFLRELPQLLHEALEG